MKILGLFVFLFSFATSATAETKFPLGDGHEKWGITLKVPESKYSLRLGARYQSLTSYSAEENLATDEKITSQDFNTRRARFQFRADLQNRGFYYMDIRSDRVNDQDRGEQSFTLGDAYFHIPLWESDSSSMALRLFRAKVDVSRTQKVSSADLLFVNRPQVADEAASFVTHNRRATNVQLNGELLSKLTFHFAIGDGVHSDDFNDAKGNADVARILGQNFMVGGKLRFFPFTGWKAEELTETYFGEGKHFSLGLGAFNTSNIRFNQGNNGRTLSRNLYNAEASAHYKEWFITGEYFKMDGVVEDLTDTAAFRKGTSEGWYTMGEKVFPEFYFLAPFVRYEKWNRFITAGDYTQESYLYGINWYLNGNFFRVTLAYQQDNLGEDIEGDKTRVESLHLATMWHF
jgi:hypothetical protein